MQTDSRLSRSARFTAIVCAAMMALFAGLAWSAVSTKSPTYDEPIHLVSAWMDFHHHDFRCDPEHPPIWKYYAVAGTRDDDLRVDLKSPAAEETLSKPTSEFKFSAAAAYAPGNDPDALLRRARPRMLALGVLLAGLIAWWAWKLRGAVAAIVATALYCLDPNFMAHAPLMTDDVPMALLFLATAIAIWFLGKRITVLAVISVGVLLGIALTTKFSGILMLPILAILLIARALMSAPWPVRRSGLATRWQRLAASLVVLSAAGSIAWAVIWTCYGFRFLPTTDHPGGFDFSADIHMSVIGEALAEQHATEIPSPSVLSELMRTHKPGMLVRGILLFDRHHLFPQAWLAGLLFTYSDSFIRHDFLCGMTSILGWWYYFPLAMLFKTPTATILAIAGASVVLLAGWRPGKLNWTAACLIVPPAFYLASAMSSHFNLGIRYVLPVYPFVFMAIGIAASVMWQRRPRISMAGFAMLALMLLGENLGAYPDYIPFFNTPSGGSRGGLRLLSDSNLDWGQDLPLLARWQHDHPDRQLLLCYFGAADPRHYGIHYVNLRASNAPADQGGYTGQDAVLAISASNLQGAYLSQADRAFYVRMLQKEPIAVLGGSIYLYEVNVKGE